MPRVQLIDGAAAEQSHGVIQLLTEDVDDTLDTCLSGNRETIQVRTANHDGPGPQGQGLHYIGPATEPPVDEYLGPPGSTSMVAGE
jgi:hypothetical protein